MEVSALRIRLSCSSLTVLLLLVDFSDSQTAAFPRIAPNTQQHFEFDAVVVDCEGLQGLTGWRVMKRIRGGVQTCASSWSASTGPCTIKNVYPHDTGEYWCEMGGAKRSNTVNITVTAGSVILESPVLPVMEGDEVTLRCRGKGTSSNLTAVFFKDGHSMESSSTGDMTIHRVSTSNEGLYKCSISGAGESAESWLHVREHEEPHPSSHHAPHFFVLLCFGLSVVALLLLVGLLRCRKHQTVIRASETSPSSFQSSSSPQTVSGEASVAVPIEATYYAVITRPKSENAQTETTRENKKPTDRSRLLRGETPD